MADAELLKEIKNIVKWTEEGIKANKLGLNSNQRAIYESYAYTTIKKKIEEAEGKNG